MKILDENKLPVLPLSDYIARMGGPRDLPGTGVRLGLDDGDGVDRTPEELRALVWLEDVLQRARVRGWITLWTADRVCCEFLQVHPCVVYGPEWFNYGKPVTAADNRWAARWVSEYDAWAVAA